MAASALSSEGRLQRREGVYPLTYALPGPETVEPPEGEPAPAAAKLQRASRNCLRCQKPFESEGIHNRLCGNCSSAASAMPANFEGRA